MTLTITLAPDEEAKLHQKALREGLNAETVAHDVLVQALDWEAQDRAEAVEGIQRGIDAFEQGRYRRFSEYKAEKGRPFAEFAEEFSARFNARYGMS